VQVHFKPTDAASSAAISADFYYLNPNLQLQPGNRACCFITMNYIETEGKNSRRVSSTVLYRIAFTSFTPYIKHEPTNLFKSSYFFAACPS
jgi:hypothetical protein